MDWPSRFLLAIGLALFAVAASGHAVPIVWAPTEFANVRSPHGALLVPVEFGATRCLMQVDTAAVDTAFYPGSLSPGVFEQHDDFVVVRSMAIGGVAMARTRFSLFKGQLFDSRPEPCSVSHPDVLVGTIGLNAFEGHSIAIDMQAGTFEVVPLSAPDPARQGATTLPFATLRGVDASMPILQARGEGGRQYTLLLDTGSAPIATLFYREPAWLAETTVATRSQPFNIVRWGHGATCRLGDGVLDIPGQPTNVSASDRIVYCAMAGETVADGNRMDGLIGLRPFETRKLTIDFVKRRVVVEPGALAAPGQERVN